MTDANREFLANHDHLQSLGVVIEHQDDGSVRLSLPYHGDLVNPGTASIQGGVVATLIDHAGGAALRTTLEEPLATPHATTDLNVSYLTPATGDLTAEATVLRAGGSVAVIRVEVRTGTGEDERLVATGRVTLHLDRS